MNRIYETDRFYLTPFTRELAEGNYKNWWTDQEITKYNSHGLFPMTPKEMASFFASIDNGEMIVWGIIVKKEFSKKRNSRLAGDNRIDHHIGNVSLQRFDWINRSAEFAVVIGEKDFWGKGYTTEAATFLFEHGFKKLNLWRIWTGTAFTNEGMHKVAKKLGMKREGLFREAIFLEGNYVDVVEFGVLKWEWDLKNEYEIKECSDNFPDLSKQESGRSFEISIIKEED